MVRLSRTIGKLDALGEYSIHEIPHTENHPRFKLIPEGIPYTKRVRSRTLQKIRTSQSDKKLPHVPATLKKAKQIFTS